LTLVTLTCTPENIVGYSGKKHQPSFINIGYLLPRNVGIALWGGVDGIILIPFLIKRNINKNHKGTNNHHQPEIKYPKKQNSVIIATDIDVTTILAVRIIDFAESIFVSSLIFKGLFIK
jgi:hypothetical protein